jgi:drug/metabolite transporter (DMT)-like permease
VADQVPSLLWVVFTLIAATAQTFRNAAQRSLIDKLGTVGATHVRFLFGLPFGFLILIGCSLAWREIPSPNSLCLLWTVFGAITQIIATALMLAAMRERSFVVTTAYTQTEPVLVALFAAAFLGEPVSVTLAFAIVIACGGVLLLSWPSRVGKEIYSWRPAGLGVGSGAFFALTAVGYRGGIVSLEATHFVPAAVLTLAIALTVQTTLLTIWLVLRDPLVLKAILKEWRVSVAAGFLGAFASANWFLAFAITNPARVRTLGLVEIVVAGLISRRLFAQSPGLCDVLAMFLVCIGVVLLFVS